MRILALLLLLVASPAFAQDSPLVGNWKLVSFQTSLDNAPPTHPLGANPKGYLILTPGGRLHAVFTSLCQRRDRRARRQAGPLAGRV